MDEKQMRKAYQKWAKEQGHPFHDIVVLRGPASSDPELIDSFSEMAEKAWLACYQHLAPMVEDAERLSWMLDNPHWRVIYEIPRGGHIRWAMTEEGERWGQWHADARKAIDAAREQEKKTC